MIQRNFWRNVLPSVIAFAFSGVYSIVDGMFVGQGGKGCLSGEI